MFSGGILNECTWVESACPDGHRGGHCQCYQKSLSNHHGGRMRKRFQKPTTSNPFRPFLTRDVCRVRTRAFWQTTPLRLTFVVFFTGSGTFERGRSRSEPSGKIRTSSNLLWNRNSEFHSFYERFYWRMCDRLRFFIRMMLLDLLEL
jgi:hypothetical protein